ncbi:MAG: hypothetical protein ACE5RC_07940, partial [Nitrosopumilus sp.]
NSNYGSMKWTGWVPAQYGEISRSNVRTKAIYTIISEDMICCLKITNKAMRVIILTTPSL